MGGKDFTLDPRTLDLIPSSTGFFEMDETAASAVTYQLTHEKDQWDGDEEAGSLLHLAKELGATDEAAQYIAVEGKRALDVLANADLISEPTMAATTDSGVIGRLNAKASFRDNSTGDRLSGAVPLFGGG